MGGWGMGQRCGGTGRSGCGRGRGAVQRRRRERRHDLVECAKLRHAPTRTTMNVNLDLPIDLERLSLPEALDRRLRTLLDKQDAGETLAPDERAEAEGIVEMAELLSLLKLRAVATLS